MGALLLALALGSDGVTFEAFVDKGDVFIRGGATHGLEVGSEVAILGEAIGDTDERRTVGRALVVETWARLARVRLPDGLDPNSVKSVRWDPPTPPEPVVTERPRRSERRPNSAAGHVIASSITLGSLYLVTFLGHLAAGGVLAYLDLIPVIGPFVTYAVTAATIGRFVPGGDVLLLLSGALQSAAAVWLIASGVVLATTAPAVSLVPTPAGVSLVARF